MSSNPSPDLELDLRAPRALLTALTVWLCALAVSVAQVDGLPRAALLIAIALLVPAVIGLSRFAPGLARAAPRRVVWAADGVWRLRDGYGREWSAALDGGSRRWGPVTLLVWRAGGRRWRALLTPATVGRDAYRRLSVRLRLARHA